MRCAWSFVAAGCGGVLLLICIIACSGGLQGLLTNSNDNDNMCFDDTSAPTITGCPEPRFREVASEDAQVPMPDFTREVSALDNCTLPGNLEITQNPPQDRMVGVGRHEVTITVADAAGETRECMTSFTVGTPCGLVTSQARRISGTIQDVLDTVERYDDPNYFVLETHRNVRYVIELDLRITDAEGNFSGTGQVRWTSHAFNIERADACQRVNYDWNDRTWTVNLTGRLSCSVSDGRPQVTISAGGAPNGSDVPQRYRIHNDCFDRTEETDERATWSGFFETGLTLDTEYLVDNELGFLLQRIDLALPPGSGGAVSGERYKDYRLEIEG